MTAKIIMLDVVRRGGTEIVPSMTSDHLRSLNGLHRNVRDLHIPIDTLLRQIEDEETRLRISLLSMMVENLSAAVREVIAHEEGATF